MSVYGLILHYDHMTVWFVFSLKYGFMLNLYYDSIICFSATHEPFEEHKIKLSNSKLIKGGVNNCDF